MREYYNQSVHGEIDVYLVTTKNGFISSNGGLSFIFSYNTLIGVVGDDGVWWSDYHGYSNTTSHHISKALNWLGMPMMYINDRVKVRAHYRGLHWLECFE